MAEVSKSRCGLVILLGAVTAVTAFLVFLPALQNSFVNWDDTLYVYKSPMMKMGLGGDFFRWASSAIVAGNWHPLTLFSHAVDYTLFGTNPKGHHFTSVFIHSLNTFLVFLLTARLVSIGRYGPTKLITFDRRVAVTAVVATLFFALHPLRVESVVWISERKDLLCAFFYLLTILAYLRFALSTETGKRASWQIVSLIFLALALLSKPMAVSLPLILILLDIYPLGRAKTIRMKQIFAEKFPYFALSVSVAMMTIWAQGKSGAISSFVSYPLATRVLNAFSSMIFYLKKTFIPIDLAPYYPYPKELSIASGEFIMAIIVFVVITAICFAFIKKRQALLSLWLFYIITLLPVLGIVQVGAQAAADRYTYLASIAPALIIGLVASRLFNRSKSGQALAVILTIIIAVGLSVNTRAQAGIWKDSITLWSYEISLYPDSVPIAYTNRGIAYGELGRIKDAALDFTKAIELKPDHAKAYYNRARAYSIMGRQGAAIDDLSIAIELRPNYANAIYNRASAYANIGRYKKAAIGFKRNTELNPEDPDAYLSLARIYLMMNKKEEAIKELRRATALGSLEAEAILKREEGK